jgi:hypothetical protein
MFLILICTTIGFAIGFAFVIHQRKLRPGKLLSVALIALISAGVVKVLIDHVRKNRWS